jgi:flagellar hook-basal body complex protein FliE
MAIGPVEGLPLTAPRGLTDPEVTRPFGSPEGRSVDASSAAAGTFESVLGDLVVSTNQRLHAATQAGQAFADGKSDDIHGTMLAFSEADISLKLAGNVRNKLFDAFYELWRMSI